ncbi:Hypothetical protein CINCED_3A015246 [Cinara cedri]|uniref:Uncharacterized protein n=1 Tax=Cinara cedri TaxID=506608 RepID=A0A5E4N2E4_9HEMI|nr:Hypothetical protein CINCED_3A015246 [Cinara cedri]
MEANESTNMSNINIRPITSLEQQDISNDGLPVQNRIPEDNYTLQSIRLRAGDDFHFHKMGTRETKTQFTSIVYVLLAIMLIIRVFPTLLFNYLPQVHAFVEKYYWLILIQSGFLHFVSIYILHHEHVRKNLPLNLIVLTIRIDLTKHGVLLNKMRLWILKLIFITGIILVALYSEIKLSVLLIGYFGSIVHIIEKLGKTNCMVEKLKTNLKSNEEELCKKCRQLSECINKCNELNKTNTMLEENIKCTNLKLEKWKCDVELLSNTLKLKCFELISLRYENQSVKVLRVFRIIIWSRNLDINRVNMREIECFEMWFYRRMLYIVWTDRITNQKILDVERKRTINNNLSSETRINGITEQEQHCEYDNQHLKRILTHMKKEVFSI